MIEGVNRTEERLLRYIAKHVASIGKAPSTDQMADHMGYRSTNSIFRMVKSLEARGFLERTPGKYWSLRVVHEISSHDAINLASHLVGNINPPVTLTLNQS